MMCKGDWDKDSEGDLVGAWPKWWELEYIDNNGKVYMRCGVCMKLVIAQIIKGEEHV